MKKNLFLIAIVFLTMAIAFNSCKCRKKESCSKKASCSMVKADSLLGLWNNAWNTKNLEALKGMIAEKAIVIEKDWKVEGRDSIMVNWISKELPKDNNLTTTPIAQCSCCCCVSYTGYYSLDIINKEGTKKEKGNFTFIWRMQENKSWKLELMHITVF